MNLVHEGNRRCRIASPENESAFRMGSTETRASPGPRKTSKNSALTSIIGEQENREAVAKDAVHQLINSTVTTDSDREIDVDWLTAFWKLAETKSKPEVQTLLSRILVGEITRPGSVSPQTLQILSVLTTDVALRFERLCNLSIEDEDSTYVIHPHVFPFQHIGPLDAYGISLADLQMLDGMRLIQAAETTVLNIADAAPPEFDDVNYAGVSARLSLSGKQMHLIFLTQAGRELRRLLELKQLDSYTQELKTKFGDQFQV
ncbi:Protein of unknown function [Burkholderia sp. D7]|nr:Protein of unknown function [Burkholderia sp. D7]